MEDIYSISKSFHILSTFFKSLVILSVASLRWRVEGQTNK